ncbi:AAA family ATPase [Campylobacter sp. 2457A]|uniref:AAA family ATPase n=1 Tax=Campylobacter sp. 2457A TaxID=2735784 RepID=UPI00301C2041|nr:AAA family ATPase [Campylobacter sp. 2457A]
MWNLDKKESQELADNFLQFQEVWTLDRVQEMTLKEYTSVLKENPNRDDFTFWIENKLGNIGSIWGGSSFKFGIYRRNDEGEKKSSKGRLYNQNYAWLSKYGNNQDEAFENVKKIIVKIIQASKNNDLEAIEKINFGDAVKWKIAFHYQDIKNIKIVNIFSKDVLNVISKNKFKQKLKTCEIYRKLIEDENLSLIDMINKIANPLWFEYGENSENYIREIKELFFNFLKSELHDEVIKEYIDAIDNISKKFLDKSLYSCSDNNEFYRNKHKLDKDKNFLSENLKNGNMYFNALKYYEKFFKVHFGKDIQDENISLNQILYGPPGTGKTYHTIDKALEILGENLENRIDKKAKFDEYVKNGQIVFTTFHQSYGYEEFVEGIKPIINKDNENSKELEYEIKDGVFKRICNRALNKERKVDNNEIDDITINNDTPIWKISLGPNASLRDKCFKENKIYIGWYKIPENMNEEFLALGTNDKSTINNFKDEMQIGDLVCVFNSLKTIKGVGIIKSDVKYGDDKEEYRTYRDVKWISKDSEISLYELNDSKNLTLKTVYKLWRIRANDLLEKIKNEKEQIDIKTIDDNTEKKFVIIIDEINRGNVSKIFGELITLIEPSKRIGAEEELRVTLPYSGEKFGVPENVYIIGTMNTADRSITSLDTALRRRFEFVEMMPNPKELENLEYKKDVDLSKLLTAINTRIEYLLDREKTIGHAFFIGVKNLENLKSVFQNKIIPLLQEYFYDDYALINAVLNNNGMVKKAENKENDYLHSIKKLETYNEKIIYNITSFDNEIWDEIETYQKIYENQISNNKTEENNKNND